MNCHEYDEDDDSDEEARDDPRNRYVHTNSNNCMPSRRTIQPNMWDGSMHQRNDEEDDEEARDVYSTKCMPSTNPPRANSTNHSNSNHFNQVPAAKHGYAYIIHHLNFEDPQYNERFGSEKDIDVLMDVVKQFDMEFEIINDADVQTIAGAVAKIAKKDFSHTEYLVIAILSHGERYNEIVAKNGKYSIIDDIILKLQNETLKDKPIIFFIQACKGDKMVTDGGRVQLFRLQELVIPDNILILYSTFEGYTSFRHPDYGTYFIQSLCKMLIQYGMNEDIMDVFGKVSKHLKEENIGQVPSYSGNLADRFCFGDYVKK